MEPNKQQWFTIPGDMVNRITAPYEDGPRSAIRWLHAHASEHNLSLRALGELIGYDKSVIHHVFNGTYTSSLEPIVQRIEKLKAKVDARAAGRAVPFIETALSRKIWKICDLTLEFQKCSFIFGDSQIGKSRNLLKYRDDHNHGATIYTSIPTGGNLSLYLAEMARALRFSPNQRERELRRRCMEAFDDRMLLIVDEVHQAVMSGHERLWRGVVRHERIPSGDGGWQVHRHPETDPAPASLRAPAPRTAHPSGSGHVCEAFQSPAGHGRGAEAPDRSDPGSGAWDVDHLAPHGGQAGGGQRQDDVLVPRHPSPRRAQLIGELI
jgi:hypothetical protein